MDSSAKKLLEAVIGLKGARDGSPDWNELDNAGNDAYEIGGIFINCNQGLTDGWRTTAHFCDLLSRKLWENINELYAAMKEFSESTIDEEAKASNAASDANDSDESILSEFEWPTY